MKVDEMPSDSRKVKVPLDRSFYLLHPYNSCLITSKGKTGKPNIMTVAWIIPVSADPPLLAISIRPERYSHDIILESGEFMVNIPTFDLAQEVLFCGRRSGREHDKFKITSLHPQKALKVSAPAIKECVSHLECKVVNTVKAGDHTLIIGEIIQAYATEGYFNQIYNLKEFRPCLHLGKNYFTTCMKNTKEPKLNAK